MDNFKIEIQNVNYKFTTEQAKKIAEGISRILTEVFRKVVKWIRDVLNHPKFKELMQKIRGYRKERKPKITDVKSKTFKLVKFIPMQTFILNKRKRCTIRRTC